MATAAGVINVEDGIDESGTLKFIIPSGTAVGVYHFGGVGIKCKTGAYLDYQAGPATGSVALLVQLAAGSTIAA